MEKKELHYLKKATLRPLEIAFLIGGIGLNLQGLIQVGANAIQWTLADPAPLILYLSSALVFVQLVLRYLAITHVYDTEITLSAWTFSTIALGLGYALIHMSVRPRIWFMLFAILWLTLAVKDAQCRKSVADEDRSSHEKRQWLQELLITEIAIAVVLIGVFIGSAPRLGGVINDMSGDAIFVGAILSAFLALLPTGLAVSRTIRTPEVFREARANFPGWGEAPDSRPSQEDGDA